MTFYNQIDNKEPFKESIFKYKTLKKEINDLLKIEFTKEEIEKIMYKNALNIYKEIS